MGQSYLSYLEVNTEEELFVDQDEKNDETVNGLEMGEFPRNSLSPELPEN